ncbi:LOW QUALITY PROTEIN: cell wall protein DAN4-like [Etheostoma spectabile]|uniref:LOW QUALITY PROTEIN: cell wall protein DAN4-like n=1 Tax=Etheostoma spectabile TaxID=54343 RepID=UPI0013AF11F8|nr:LOW QUALITY PROTEIN: cell wall protein DAN4-like [Etheostoma spectabile]
MTEMESTQTGEISKITVEDIRPAVESFIKGMTLEQQRLLVQGAPDDATSILLAEMILDLISLVSKSILATLQNKYSQIISEEHVRSSLGDTLPLTFAEILQVKDPVHCDSSTKLNNMFVREVAQSINSAISNSVDTLEPVFSERVTPPHRLNLMVQHAFNMLKAFLGKMKDVLCSCRPRKPRTRQDIYVQKAADGQQEMADQEEADHCQSAARSGESKSPDKVSRTSEHFVSVTTIAVREIITNEVSGLTEPLLDEMTDSGYDQLQSDTSREIHIIADDITELIVEEVNSLEEQNAASISLEPTETSTSPEPTETSTSSEHTETSTSPEPTETSTSPESTETSTSPEPKEKSTSSEPTETSTSSELMETSTSPVSTETSTSLVSTETSTSPEPTETSTSPEPTETSTSSEPTETTTCPEPMVTSTSSELTKTSTSSEPTETSTSPGPTETNTSPEPTETSTSSEPTETSTSSEPTKSTSPEPTEISTSSEPTETSTSPVSKETSTSPVSTETSTSPEPIETSTNPVPAETSTSSEPTETSTSSEPTVASTSSEPTENSTSPEPTEKSTSSEPKETSTSSEPTETSSSFEPKETSTSQTPTETSVTTEFKEKLSLKEVGRKIRIFFAEQFAKMSIHRMATQLDNQFNPYSKVKREKSMQSLVTNVDSLFSEEGVKQEVGSEVVYSKLQDISNGKDQVFQEELTGLLYSYVSEGMIPETVPGSNEKILSSSPSRDTVYGEIYCKVWRYLGLMKWWLCTQAGIHSEKMKKAFKNTESLSPTTTPTPKPTPSPKLTNLHPHPQLHPHQNLHLYRHPNLHVTYTQAYIYAFAHGKSTPTPTVAVSEEAAADLCRIQQHRQRKNRISIRLLVRSCFADL